MMKKRNLLCSLILLSLLFVLLYIPVVAAVEYPFTVVYDVKPPSGPSDQEILILIRVDHPNPNESRYPANWHDHNIEIVR